MKYHTVGPLAIWQHKSNAGNPTCRVLLIHGLGEHSGRHGNTIQFLNSVGIEVIAFDLRGCGHSSGKRQWIESFRDYVQDTATVFDWAEKTLSSLPLFVLGHSLGGAIAICFTEQYQKLLQGLVLSAPAFKVGSEITPAKI
jgi:alpha-beta hydrolase superfamily lysophospholipase